MGKDISKDVLSTLKSLLTPGQKVRLSLPSTLVANPRGLLRKSERLRLLTGDCFKEIPDQVRNDRVGWRKKKAGLPRYKTARNDKQARF